MRQMDTKAWLKLQSTTALKTMHRNLLGELRDLITAELNSRGE